MSLPAGGLGYSINFVREISCLDLVIMLRQLLVSISNFQSSPGLFQYLKYYCEKENIVQ